VTKTLLQRLGYTVIVGKSGVEAMELAETHDGDIELVLLDMILPDMGGKEIYQRLSEVRPNAKVIVSSGYSIDGPAKEILDAGADSFIQKPFTINDLSSKIAEVLEE
jgi:CheY-like chemotaxis protein